MGGSLQGSVRGEPAGGCEGGAWLPDGGMAVRGNPKGLRGEAQLHNGIPPPVALGKSPGLSELHFRW